jgi:hypothetical protein
MEVGDVKDGDQPLHGVMKDAAQGSTTDKAWSLAAVAYPDVPKMMEEGSRLTASSGGEGARYEKGLFLGLAN